MPSGLAGLVKKARSASAVRAFFVHSARASPVNFSGSSRFSGEGGLDLQEEIG
jgi:hypothetical protein